MADESLGNQDYIKKSRFSELEVPDFKTTIPPSLLEGKDEADRILYNSINIQNQQLSWLIKSIKENNRLLRITNGRVNIIEGWKSKLSSGWGVLLATITFLGSVIGLITAIYKIFIG